MARSIYDRGLLKPFEIAKLRRVFDDACATRKTDPDSQEARDLALNILALHEAGMQDEQALRSAVSFSLPKTKH